MSKPTKSVSCSCGKVLFDENCEPADKLTCPGCKKKYRYLGGNEIELIGSNKVKADESNVEVLSVEVFKIDVPEKIDEKDFAGRLKAHSAKRAKPKAQPTEAELAAKKEQRAKEQAKQIPGGVVPMIGFIVAFNAIALITLAVGFPLQPDGSRGTPFGVTIPKMSVPWPTLGALILGHVFGFGAWMGYVYRLHKKKREGGDDDEDGDDSSRTSTRKRDASKSAARKAVTDDDDDDDDEIIDEDDEEAIIRARTRKMPAVGPRRGSDDDDDDEDDEDEDEKPKRPSPRRK